MRLETVVNTMANKWETVEYDDDGEVIAPEFLAKSGPHDLFLTITETRINGKLYSKVKGVSTFLQITRIGSHVTKVAEIIWPD
jgi:hypothetical protein